MVFLMFPILFFGIIVLMISSFWKVFEKAGIEGWYSLIPILNLIMFVKIIEKPSYYFLLFLVPGLHVMPFLELAKYFNKSTLFGLGLAFLPFVFFPVLAFGPAEYISIEIDETDHLIA
jgi:hypothetical protein